MRSEPVRDAGQREGEHRGPSAAIEGTRSPTVSDVEDVAEWRAGQRPCRCFACPSVHLGGRAPGPAPP